MTNLKTIVQILTHLAAVVVALTAFYYLKYRPVRNEYQSAKALEQELRKQVKAKDLIIDAVWSEYYKLAKVPRYSIDQRLDRIKVKRNSSLEFIPNVAMTITDSVKLYEGDSVIIKPPDDSSKYRHRWWQLWKKRKIKNQQ